jgi:hypothetical protein
VHEKNEEEDIKVKKRLEQSEKKEQNLLPRQHKGRLLERVEELEQIQSNKDN